MKRTGARRTILLLSVMMVALLLGSGVALAATLIGNNRPNLIIGTNFRDTIRGLGGNDRIDGRGGADRIDGGFGHDRMVDGQLSEFNVDDLRGGFGNDVINTDNSPDSQDLIDCGPGFDTLTADGNDLVRRCEDIIVASPTLQAAQEAKEAVVR